MNIYKIAGPIGSVVKKLILVFVGSLAGSLMAIKFAKKGGII